MSNPTIKLASRTSALALFQTEAVIDELRAVGISGSLVPVKTKGDKDQHTALQHLGQTGIFTKAIDDAILEGTADVGVHSLKDYPTAIPKGLALLAVLPRDGYLDAFIPGTSTHAPTTLRSGSPRRKAQWLRRHPEHAFQDLRGNMDTRLAKIRKSGGGIVSAPGLERLGMLPEDAEVLDWMVPAPAAGVMAIIGRDDAQLKSIFAKINHETTLRQATVERDFMAAVEGGCASPLGALCTGDGDTWNFTGVLLSEDGTEEIRVTRTVQPEDWQRAGSACAQELLDQGGATLMARIKATQPLDVLCLKEISSEERALALEQGVKLHDVDVLKLVPKTFRVRNSTLFMVGSSFGAQQLLSVHEQLPEVGICIGNKAHQELRKAGYNGVLHVLNSSAEALQFIQGHQLRDITYYGAAQTSVTWEEHGIHHVVTYINTPSEPRLARQQWDAIAAFSPLGVKSVNAHNAFPKNTPVVTIGPTTLNACKSYGFFNAAPADSPTIDSMIDALKRLKK